MNSNSSRAAGIHWAGVAIPSLPFVAQPLSPAPAPLGHSTRLSCGRSGAWRAAGLVAGSLASPGWTACFPPSGIVFPSLGSLLISGK